MTWFEHDGRPVAVDQTHPVDILEPEDESTDRGTRDAVKMIDWIGGSYLRGDPFIIQVAWSFLLNQQSRSMEACAKELACGSQAHDGLLFGDGGEEFDLDSEAAGHQWRCHG